MLPAERQNRISELLNEKGVVYVSDLSERFNVSELTIRRDLDRMAENKVLKRTHGGAARIRDLSAEAFFIKETEKSPDEKNRIGLKAAELVEDGDTVMVNAGTTASSVLKAILESGKEVTVITNNIDIFSHTDPYGKCKVIICGGVYNSRLRSISGAMSMRSLDGLYADKAFIGTDGISHISGLTTPAFEEGITSGIMIEHTTKAVYVVAPHDKIGKVSNYKFANPEDITALITGTEGAAELKNREDCPFEVIEV